MKITLLLCFAVFLDSATGALAQSETVNKRLEAMKAKVRKSMNKLKENGSVGNLRAIASVLRLDPIEWASEDKDYAKIREIYGSIQEIYEVTWNVQVGCVKWKTVKNEEDQVTMYTWTLENRWTTACKSTKPILTAVQKLEAQGVKPDTTFTTTLPYNDDIEYKGFDVSRLGEVTVKFDETVKKLTLCVGIVSGKYVVGPVPQDFEAKIKIREKYLAMIEEAVNG